jgi:hypothetical protein
VRSRIEVITEDFASRYSDSIRESFAIDILPNIATLYGTGHRALMETTHPSLTSSGTDHQKESAKSDTAWQA